MFSNPQFYEGLMLVCFGASWPFAILKTIRAKNPAGKSFLFAFFVITGYIGGSIAKYMRGGVDLVFCLYLIDMTMVTADTILCWYYLKKRRSLEKTGN